MFKKGSFVTYIGIEKDGMRVPAVGWDDRLGLEAIIEEDAEEGDEHISVQFFDAEGRGYGDVCRVMGSSLERVIGIFLLQEDRIKPVPDSIKILDAYGRDAIHYEGKRYIGNVLHVRGTTQAFASWLGEYDGVWVSTNPMLGEWNVVHIKDELIA